MAFKRFPSTPKKKEKEEEKLINCIFRVASVCLNNLCLVSRLDFEYKEDNPIKIKIHVETLMEFSRNPQSKFSNLKFE